MSKTEIPIPTTANRRSVIYVDINDPDPARTAATRVAKGRYGKTGTVKSVREEGHVDSGWMFKIEIVDQRPKCQIAYDRFCLIVPDTWYHHHNKKGGAE